MRKLKIYLDTSVISHLDAPDRPDWMADTLALWDDIKAGVYDVVISSVVERELNKCDEPKLSTLHEYLQQIPFDMVLIDEQALAIADKVIEMGILTPKSIDDCQHIAAAIVSSCDVIVSWNFQHMVNYRTIQGVRAVTAISGYPEILIFTPTILIGGDRNDT